MTDKSNSRLYYPPHHTIDTLSSIISGSKTQEQIAEDLDVGERTVKNKIHDPIHLGLVEGEDGEYEATREAKRLVQLDEEEVLEDLFVELPGVDDVQDRMENGGITVEEVGRVISFETDSGAADPETFRRYGNVYASWIDYLDLGEVEEETEAESSHPLENPRGASEPRVPPQKVIQTLRVMGDVSTREEIAQRLDHSEKEAEKTLSTAYGLGVARTQRHGGVEKTEFGRKVVTASGGNQRELFRESLLQIPLVQAYCNRVPDGEFASQEVMEQVSEDYSMGWGEQTIKTKANRISPWLTFTELAEGDKPGQLEATEKMPRDDLADP